MNFRFFFILLSTFALAVLNSPVRAQEANSSFSLEGPAAEADCNKPVYLFSLLKINDREKLKDYIKAMMKAGLRVKNGGRYVNSGKPLEVLEGEWTDDHSMLLIEFPCAAAAQSYWHNDVYQNEIKPLRKEAGDLIAAIFELNEK